MARKKTSHRWAFFIESDNEVADRFGMQEKDVSIVYPPQLDPQQASVLSLFQYLIANTDWSAIKGPADEDCCHNGKVIGPPDSNVGWMVIPYDFDQSGIINARYAKPSDQLGIRTVRQRLYRGRCVNLDQLDSTIAQFNDERSAITAALLPEDLQGSARDSASAYIDDFYKIVNDPAQRKKNIEGRCLGD